MATPKKKTTPKKEVPEKVDLEKRVEDLEGAVVRLSILADRLKEQFGL